MKQQPDRDAGNGDADSSLDDDAPAGELYADVERRALYDMPVYADDEESAPDLVGALGGHGVETAEPAHDLTLGGYIEKHDRVPAFEGSDGQPYTVDVDVEEDGADAGAPFVAFLIFIRWAATGAGIMDHLESGDVGRGASADEARHAAMELSLYEIRAELDAAIERRRAALED